MKKIQKNINKTHHWITILRRRGSLLFCNFVIVGQSRSYFQEMLDFDFEIRNFKYIDGEISIDLNEVTVLGNLVVQRIEKDPYFLREFINKCKVQCERLLEVSRQISNINDFQALTTTELKEWLQKYVEEVLRMMPFLNIFAIMERIFEEKVSAGLKEKLKDEELIDEYLRYLIFPREENYVVKELHALIEITAEIQRKPELQEIFKKESEEVEKELKEREFSMFSKLEDHANTFGFLGMYCYEGEPLKIKDVIREIQALLREDCNKKLQQIKQQKQYTEEKYRAVLDELRISGELLEFIEYIQEYLYFRLYRLDVLFIAGFYVRNFLEEIGQRMGLSYDDVINLSYEEIMNFFDKSILPDKAKIKEREKGYAVLFIDGELEIISGENLFNLISKEEKRTYEQVEEIEGTIASPGEHRGTVKIVTHRHHVDKVKEDDVLVSPMTNPYYVPAMIQAGAIVTDEGGILSHAAIVARELGKSCIIGTEIATRALKDGDIVEVNALGKKGIIRILRR